MSSTSRMLELLSLLQTCRAWPGDVLAERLEVTPRTVRRDVERLRDLGYRIDATHGPGAGYRMAAGSQLPPLQFDDDQAVAVAVALQHAAATGVDIDESAARALATVQQVMPSRLRHRVDGIRFTPTAAAELVAPSVLEAVSAAVRERRVLRFDYGGEDAARRRVEPHAVVASDARWYLVAWDLDRDDWRIFRLDRMTPRIPLGAVFAPRPLPAADPREFVAARFKGSPDGDRWPCVGEVVVDLPAHELVPWVVEGELTALTETSTRVVLGSWSWAGLAASVLRFDAPFRIVGPDDLREAARSLAGRLSAAVGGSA